MSAAKITSLLIILMITFFSYFYRKDTKNPSFIYSLYWFTLLAMYSFRLYGLYSTDDRPYIFIAIGSVFFFLGTLGNRIVVIGKKTLSQERVIYYSENIIIILFIISFAIFLRKNIISILSIIRGGSIYSIRYSMSASTSYIEDVLVKFLARPFSATLSCIGLAEMLDGNRNSKKHLFLGIVLMLQSLLFDGTLVMFEFLIASVAIMLLVLITTKFSFEQLRDILSVKKIKKTLILILLIAVIGLFLAKGSIFKTVYMHFAPSIIYLEERLKTIDAGRYNNDIMIYTYGFSSLQGIVRPIMAVLERVGINSQLFDSATSFLLDNHDYVINVANGEYFNFFATSFAFYYKDFGIIGIILFPYLFGLICNQIYIRFMNYRNLHTIALYIFIVSGILLTVKVSLFSYTEIIVGLYWLFLCRRERK